MTARLALFDCDGTLADSQHAIVAAMRDAFAEVGIIAPPAAAIRQTIGLSLPMIMHRLVPDGDSQLHGRLVDAYRELYFRARSATGALPEPLYDGIVDVLDSLAQDGWLLGVATGKSTRGLDRLLAAHGIRDRFVTLQTADGHPSKPHPAMALTAMAEADVRPRQTVVIGDTAHDMAMATAAGARALGVEWGYHSAADLRRSGAEMLCAQPKEIPAALSALYSEAI